MRPKRLILVIRGGSIVVRLFDEHVIVPNAQRYTGEFFGYGWIPNIVLMAVLAIFCFVIWPLMGMPVVVPQ